MLRKQFSLAVASALKLYSGNWIIRRLEGNLGFASLDGCGYQEMLRFPQSRDT
jgi:hypothetical protein